MTLSAKAKQSALAQQTSELWLFLLEIHHSTLPTGLRYVNDNQPLTSHGQVYNPAVFSLTLNIDDESHLPDVALAIDNVDRSLIEAVRSTGTAPTFDIRLVLHSTPEVYEIEIVGLTMLEASYDAYILSGTLIFDDLLNTRYPADIVSPADGYNGLYRQ